MATRVDLSHTRLSATTKDSFQSGQESERKKEKSTLEQSHCACLIHQRQSTAYLVCLQYWLLHLCKARRTMLTSQKLLHGNVINVLFSNCNFERLHASQRTEQIISDLGNLEPEAYLMKPMHKFIEAPEILNQEMCLSHSNNTRTEQKRRRRKLIYHPCRDSLDYNSISDVSSIFKIMTQTLDFFHPPQKAEGQIGNNKQLDPKKQHNIIAKQQMTKTSCPCKNKFKQIKKLRAVRWPLRVSGPLHVTGWDCSDKQARQNDNVPRGNLIRMSCVSLTNSGYFAVIYLCLLSGGRQNRRPGLSD